MPMGKSDRHKKPAIRPYMDKLRPRRKSRLSRFVGFSSLARVIFISNLVGLIILIVGALTLNQFSRGLINAKVENLTSQTRLITNLLGDQATGLGAVARLDENAARQIMRRIDLPEKARVRLYDKSGLLIADSDLLDDRVEVGVLDPIVPKGEQIAQQDPWWIKLQNWLDKKINDLPVYKKHRMSKQRHLQRDIKTALLGDMVASEQYENDKLLVAVSMPVKRVQDVQGAVVFETHDVDTILASQRRGLTPIILIAVLASILSSLALTLFIALPVRKLARAAEQVRRSSDKRNAIPDLSGRGDEIGDLSVVLRDMTEGLYNRIDDIANFAADVAHEIKNPLTSLRSASETLRIAKTKDDRDRMLGIIEKDVSRMTRLITDISKASRMDAALAKETAGPVDLQQFIENIAELYNHTFKNEGLKVVTKIEDGQDSEDKAELIVKALENSLGQVLRNLIDNALTFSPKEEGTSVRIIAKRGEGDEDGFAVIYVDDDGPGIPPDQMEKIFNRFYTQRPDGAAFGDHSGLGLAICRQIMKAHGGEISAQNRKGADGEILGARFKLTLPLDTTRKRK